MGLLRSCGASPRDPLRTEKRGGTEQSQDLRPNRFPAGRSPLGGWHPTVSARWPPRFSRRGGLAPTLPSRLKNPPSDLRAFVLRGESVPDATALIRANRGRDGYEARVTPVRTARLRA